MVRHSRARWVILCFFLCAFASAQLFAQTPQPSSSSQNPGTPGQSSPAVHNDVVIRGGTLLTVTHGRIENGSTALNIHLAHTMIRVYELDDTLLDEVRAARRRGWWKAYGISDKDFIALENGASAISTFSFVPSV